MSRIPRKFIAVLGVITLAVGAFSAMKLLRPDDPVRPVVVVAPAVDPLPEARQPRAALAPGLLDATSMSVQDVPKRLYLIDTTPGRTPTEGSARIGVDPRVPQSYSAGAVLLNGARLAQIHNRYVVLARGHERARLDLYDPKSVEKSASAQERGEVRIRPCVRWRRAANRPAAATRGRSTLARTPNVACI
jgi:hypothetical protein